MNGISADMALLAGLVAAALIFVILTVRSVEWLAQWRRGSTEARLVLAHRLKETWSTPLALAPILDGRRRAREHEYSITR